MSPTPEQLQRLQELTGLSPDHMPTPEELQKVVAAAAGDPQVMAALAAMAQLEVAEQGRALGAASVPDSELMRLLAEDEDVPEDVLQSGTFDDLLAQLDPRWHRLVRFVADHLATRIPGQGEAVPKMLLEWSLGMLTSQLASDPEGSRNDLVVLIRRAITELEVPVDALYAVDGTPLPGEIEEAHADG